MISDEAVEAAASIIAQESLVNAAMDGYGWDAENDSPEPFMPHAREQARRYLEAAAPHMTGSAEAIWLEGYQAGVRDADKDAQRRKAGDFLRFDELEANPYRSQA